MKNIKNYLKFVLVMVVAFITIFTNSINVKADNGSAPDSIKLGAASTALTSYIGQTYFPIKYASDGTIMYCLNHKLDVAQNVTVYKVGELDAGIVYILNNGYPKKSITGDKNKDYYITQTAIWWYLDDTKGTSSLGQGFKSTGQDKYNLRDKVIALKEAAKKNNTYIKPSIDVNINNNNMTLSEDKKYYVSEKIGVNVENVSENYSVSISSAPNGTVVVDINGNEKSTFKTSETFIVKVPVQNIEMGVNNIIVSVSADSIIEKAYEYSPNNSEIQNVVSTILYSEKTVVSDKISLMVSKSTEVKITKVDSSSGEPVSGATLALKDSDGNVLYKWVSSKEAYTISNLEIGEYTIEELKAPDGYVLNEEGKSFSITEDNQIVEVEFENQLKPGVVSISKQDITNKQELPGATLIVKDSEGNEVARWVSTDEPYMISTLEDGIYTLEEIVAPDGYVLSNETITFEIKSGEVTETVIMYNTPETPVPITASSVSIFIYIIGIAVIGFGTKLVCFSSNK